MQLEAGKFYKTRHGVKVEILSERENIFIGWQDKFTPRTWYSDGMFRSGYESAEDLVEEWIEPTILDRWINIYAKNTFMYISKKEADEHALNDRLICLHFKIDLSKEIGDRVFEVIKNPGSI